MSLRVEVTNPYHDTWHAVDQNRFDGDDETGYSGHASGDSPVEACQELFDQQKKHGVKLSDYVKDLSVGLTDQQTISLIYHGMELLEKPSDRENPEGYALYSCVRLAEAYHKSNNCKKKEVAV